MEGRITKRRWDWSEREEAKNGEKIFAPGGQRNPLKRLKMDKGIQGNPSLFLRFLLLGLAAFGWVLLNLESAWRAVS